MVGKGPRAAGGPAPLAAGSGSTNPADLTVVELLPLLESRRLSARELVEACIARVERCDGPPTVNPWDTGRSPGGSSGGSGAALAARSAARGQRATC